MSSKELEMKAREHDMSDADPKAVAEAVEATAKEVVSGYKKMETGIVEGFNKVTDKCVQMLFAREGESVKDAKKRLQANISGTPECYAISGKCGCGTQALQQRKNFAKTLKSY